MFEQENRIITDVAAGATVELFGSGDANVRTIEQEFGVSIHPEGGSDGTEKIAVSGEGAAEAARAVRLLSDMAASKLARGESLDQSAVLYVCGMVKEGRESELSGYDEDCICVTSSGRPIRPKTVGQRKYVDLIRKNTIVLGTGPAGTGKTFLAVAMAVKALRDRQVERIILTRPAIEAGEKLGFLPGDLQSKIDPYLRPLYDALGEMMGGEKYQKCLERQTVEVAPLAYMRGRTLDDSFIILDEAQNATFEQMKMFLTRLGTNSKAVVTGDLTQTDLPYGRMSGLRSAVKILDGIPGIAVHSFTDKDVVRHKLVQRIILAYDKYEKEEAKAGRPVSQKYRRGQK